MPVYVYLHTFPRTEQQGWEGFMHGGIFEDQMGRCMALLGNEKLKTDVSIAEALRALNEARSDIIPDLHHRGWVTRKYSISTAPGVDRYDWVEEK